ncbi:nuclear speckle splicing regulatory protein 1 [Solea solea]|uniref:nuclear speckle splicing regulatory protein 1 n=1 Tax=Solea solea TaxID=90069 RepID=UPI00272C2E71|nr:nuclear speckle splicing regulatory protein 1 [Solea solea]
MAAPSKQYGLILPQKRGAFKTANLQKPSVFGDDSDDETTVGESLQREAIKKKTMKQTHLQMQKALEQDSSVYEYDAVYDTIQKQRSDGNKKVLGGTDKRPKYIHQLMKAVEDRKKEQERREERSIQKEREAEGEKFADKDAYVTSAYKQKLLEMKEEQEKEKRDAAIEAALDVRKQKDLSGFYRHLLNQTVGEEELPDRSANKSQPSNVSKDTETTSAAVSPPSQDNVPSSCSDSEEGHEQKSGFSKTGAGSNHSKRQYRQRSPSSGSEDKEKERERDRDRHKKSHRDRERDRDRDRDRNRAREREDRHGGRKDDRDRRKDRGRDEDRSRGRGETEREDRHGKRTRSPKDRARDKNGEREKRRNPVEDERKDENREEEKEKAVIKEEKEPEKEPQTKEEEEVQGDEKEEKVNKFAKRSTDQTVSSAKERFMARQMARSASRSYIEKEED